MFRAMAVALLALFTINCGGVSPTEQAQKEVDFLHSNGGSNTELCAAYEKLEKAFREARDAEGWKNAKLSRSIHCRSASLGR